MRILLVLTMLSFSAIAAELKAPSVTPELKNGSVIVRCDCCDRPAIAPEHKKTKPFPKQKVKTVTKVVEKVVEKPKYIDRPVPYEKPAETKKNTISFVIGAGIDRLHAEQVSGSATEISTRTVPIYGLRYNREVFDSYDIGIEGFTTENRILNSRPPIETANISFGVKF